MEEKRFGIRFHHKGEFLKTKYSGGICTKISNSVDADRFSYTVLMEHVKDDVGYTEIGGIYVNKGKMGGWKLVADDKDLGDFIRGFGGGDFLEFYIDNIIDNGIEPLMQMQPYVVIRPRPCLVQDKKVQPKRKFVTIQSIQKQERQKKKANEEDLNVRRKLPQGIASKDMADEENIQESNDISYEKIREMNIIENNRRIAALNLKQLSVCLSIHGEQEKGKEKFHKDSEEYCPENDSEHSSDEDDSKQTKQLQKNKVKVGPTTHSRTNIVAPNATEKEVGGSTFVQRNSSEKAKKDLVIGAHDVETDVRNTVPPSKQSCNKVLQRQGNKGIGSMAAFVALRERQKLAQIEDAQVENAQENDVDESFIVRTDDKIIETSSDITPVNKRKRRGQTKMDIVHTRRHEERKVIMLNDNFQPVADDGKSTPELSNFLGTLVRYYVPLDIIDWRKVPDKDNMWEFVKDKYIIPEEGKPWELVKKNAESRKKITDTHTAGPTSFAQIMKKLQLEKPNQEEPSKAEIFIATRKRKEGRKYKSSSEILTYRLSTIEDICSSGANSESVEQLICGDKTHGPSWLVGRRAVPRKSKEQSTENISPSYVEEVTTKIRKQLEEEWDEKMNQKMLWMMNKLGEANPNLKVDVEEICGGISSENDNVVMSSKDGASNVEMEG